LHRAKKWKTTVALLLVCLIVAIIVAVSIGPLPIALSDVISTILAKIPLLGNLVAHNASPVSQEIVLTVRLPRVLAAAIVGIGLATSGATLQGLLRNPLADPYIIGVSAGASVGATIASTLGLGFSVIGALYSIPLFAFAGAIITVLIVYNLARSSGGVSVLTLLLVGIAITSLFSALVTLMRLLSSDMALSIVFWLLGSLNLTTWNYVLIGVAVVIIVVALIMKKRA
jgi:iron complex transport system permease protein